MQLPEGWRRAMMLVAIGKAAVSGAVVVLAILGALNVASAVAAHDWITTFQKEHLDALVASGGAGGAIFRILIDRLA